jgi:transcriptional regulator with XRE-family HTH domain
MPTNGPVGERIAIYRRRRGLSQVVLAGLIGRSVSWLSQVERGTRAVDRKPGPGTVTTASDLTQLRSRVDAAWRLRQASRYAQLGHQVPDLITQAEQATQHYRADDQRAAFASLPSTPGCSPTGPGCRIPGGQDDRSRVTGDCYDGSVGARG